MSSSMTPPHRRKRATQASDLISQPSHTPLIQKMPLEKLVENSWNPNAMDPEAFEALVEEVKRRGDVLKLVIVRPCGDYYEILDGAHNVRAAKLAGLVAVSCQILLLDDVAARRETMVRNGHGEHNPLLEGQLYVEMMKLGGMSQRQLAESLGCSEGTIRNALKYGKAAKLRSGYAGSDASEEIGRLTIRQLEMYLALPDGVRDRWLDAGGDLQLLQRYRRHSSDLSIPTVFQPLLDLGLVEYLSPSISYFQATADRLLDLCDWAQQHKRIDNIQPFLQAVARHELAASVLECLPCDLTAQPPGVLITPEQWDQIISSAVARTAEPDAQRALMENGIRLALEDRGINPRTICAPETVAMLEELEAAPDFLRDVDCLSVKERYLLYRCAESDTTGLAEQAQRLAVTRLRDRRTSGRPSSGSVVDAFEACMEQLRDEELIRHEEQIFADTETLVAAVLEEVMTEMPDIESAKAGDRQAIELLAEQLHALDRPMQYLLASLLLGERSPRLGLRRWLDACGE